MSAEIAESHIRGFITDNYFEASGVVPTLAPRDDDYRRHLQEDIAEIDRQREVYTKSLGDRGTDIAVAKRRLRELSDEADAKESALNAIFARAAAGDELRNFFVDTIPATNGYLITDDIGAVRHAIADFESRWDALPVARKRAIAKGMLSVVVEPGRGASRINCKLLNPEEW